MIHDAPLAATAGSETVVEKTAAFLAAARVAAADGITWQEFGELLLALLRMSIHAIDAVGGMTGEQKKALVLDAVAALFDSLADYAVPAVIYPVWLLARPSIRALILALASGAVEIVLPMVRSQP